MVRKLASILLACLAAVTVAAGQEREPLGQLLAINERLDGGYVRRISGEHPDGELLAPGAYFYANDRIGLVQVEVTVRICNHESEHTAIEEDIHIAIPQACIATMTAPDPSQGASYAQAPVAPRTFSADLTHVVVASETLYSIARMYNVTTQSIATANGLVPGQIYVGQELTIPDVAVTLQGSDRQVVVAIGSDSGAVSQVAAVPGANNTQGQGPLVAGAGGGFAMPADGRIITDFASSRGTGINIEADVGAAVVASRAGEVIYVGNEVEGYGNLVLIKHAGGFVTAYAHLEDAVVTKGEIVSQEQQIGTVGMSGIAKSPQLHFELRRGATPIDPLPWLELLD